MQGLDRMLVGNKAVVIRQQAAPTGTKSGVVPLVALAFDYVLEDLGETDYPDAGKTASGIGKIAHATPGDRDIEAMRRQEPMVRDPGRSLRLVDAYSACMAE